MVKTIAMNLLTFDILFKALVSLVQERDKSSKIPLFTNKCYYQRERLGQRGSTQRCVVVCIE